MFDYLNVSDNVSLFYMKHLVPNPRVTIVMCHGFTNHSGDYEHYIKMLNAENYSVYSYDMRGHGKTSSELGDLDHYQTYINDLHVMVRMALRENLHIPLFTLGFSMGGLVSAMFGVQYPNTLSGQLFLGPAVGYVAAVEGNLKYLTSLGGKIAPNLWVEFKGDTISLNDPRKKETLEDNFVFTSKNPLQRKYYTMRFVNTVFVAAPNYLLDVLQDYRYPCFIMHGALDKTVHPSVGKHFYDTISSKDKSWKLYEGMHHVLYDEPDGDTVIMDSIAWLNARTSFQK